MDQKRAVFSSESIVEIEYYDKATLALHWLTVVLMLILFGSALIWNYVTPHDRYWRPILESTHVSFGILFTPLIVARIVWRLTGMRKFPPEPGISGVLSRIMYLILYVLFAAEIVSGFVLRWLQGESFRFFGLFAMPALLTHDRVLARQWDNWHNWVSWTIVILAVGHSIAALVHHFVLKDQILRRMLGLPAR